MYLKYDKLKIWHTSTMKYTVVLRMVLYVVKYGSEGGSSMIQDLRVEGHEGLRRVGDICNVQKA